jgi:hypothetical protein
LFPGGISATRRRSLEDAYHSAADTESGIVHSGEGIANLHILHITYEDRKLLSVMSHTVLG